jgi:hypothetical protein
MNFHTLNIKVSFFILVVEQISYKEELNKYFVLLKEV